MMPRVYRLYSLDFWIETSFLGFGGREEHFETDPLLDFVYFSLQDPKLAPSSRFPNPSWPSTCPPRIHCSISHFLREDPPFYPGILHLYENFFPRFLIRSLSPFSRASYIKNKMPRSCQCVTSSSSSSTDNPLFVLIPEFVFLDFPAILRSKLAFPLFWNVQAPGLMDPQVNLAPPGYISQSYLLVLLSRGTWVPWQHLSQ